MKQSLLISICLLITYATSIAQQHAGQSQVKTDTIFSEILKADRAYTIYLPKSYDTQSQKKYPILYLLHGLSGMNSNWFDKASVKQVQDQLVASGESVEMVIISPNAGGNPETEWNGYFDMPGWNYEKFFFNELLPHIESTYRIIGDKKNRAVAGLSMGGGGSAAYAQKHADMFGSVYAMSALMTIPADRSIPQNQTAPSKRQLLTKSVIENSCVDYVTNASEAQKEQLRTVKWFVDCGDDDFLLDTNIDFFRAMRAAKVPLEFRIRDGAHDWLYWHSALYTCLPFVSQNFQL